MSYVFCLPYNRNAITPTPINPADPSMIPNTFQSYYLNKNVDAVGDGQTIATPFKTFADYKQYALTNHLMNEVVLNINDADWYGDVKVVDISALSENITVNAPFATLNNVNFNNTGIKEGDSIVFIEKSTIIAGHVWGNIVLSVNSALYVIGDVGTGANGAPNPTPNMPASTILSFDNGTVTLGSVLVSLNAFKGSIDFSDITTTSDIAIYINQWTNNGSNNTALKAALKTLPSTTSSLSVNLIGQIDGMNFPRYIPSFHYKSGFPTYVTINASLEKTFNPVFYCSDTFNIESITACRFYRSSYEGTTETAQKSLDITPTSISIERSEISFTLAIASSDLAPITSASTGSLFFEIDVVLRYFDGKRDVPLTNILVYKIEHSI